MIRSASLVAALAVLAAPALPALAQSNAQLQVARIFHNGPLKTGTNTFRVTVRNSSQTAPTPFREPVVVTLIVLDPDQQRSQYEATIPSGIGTNGSQTAAFPNVQLHKTGSHTVTAYARVPPKSGRPDIKSADRSEVFNVGGAKAAAANQLTVLVKTPNNSPSSRFRVALRVDNREIDWKMTGGTGEARFPRVAPSPDGKPYTIEVKAGSKVVGSFE
ncbi:MAG: hypothetical protein R2708_05275 [Vicinamibacterales bacterium]